MDEIVFEPSDVNMLAALGTVESVKLFPFMLSMGELQYACDSEYRCKQFVNCLQNIILTAKLKLDNCGRNIMVQRMRFNVI